MKNCEKIGTVIRRDGKEDDFNCYTYELIMRRGDHVASFRIPLYSIRVSMTDAFGNKTENTVRDAFSDERRAIEFYEKALNNLATPLNLPFILEDEAFI